MNDIVYDNDQDFCPQTLAINMYKQDIQIYIWIYIYIHSFAPGRLIDIEDLFLPSFLR